MFNKKSISYNNTYVNTDSSDTLSIGERYKILIAARNFHYENFNKWMSYFYVMIASIILGFSYIISKSDGNYESQLKTELLVLSFAGFIIGLFWYWANKGYYYWNINFITLVNHYEQNLLKFKEDERVYFVFANKSTQNNYSSPISGANFSTSKISILLSYMFCLFFGYYFIYILCKSFYSYLLVDIFSNFTFSCFSFKIVTFLIVWYVKFIGIPVFVVGAIYVFSYTLGKESLSSYHEHFPDLEIKSR